STSSDPCQSDGRTSANPGLPDVFSALRQAQSPVFRRNSEPLAMVIVSVLARRLAAVIAPALTAGIATSGGSPALARCRVSQPSLPDRPFRPYSMKACASKWLRETG